MSYYRNNEANREALFGAPSSTSSPSGGGGGRRSTPSGIRTGPIVDFSTYQRKNSAQSSTTSATAIRSTAATGTISSNSSISSQSASSLSTGGGSNLSGLGMFGGSSKKGGAIRVLSGVAKLAKMKEAEEYRDKAKKAMERGLFSKPDPVIAATYYRRAAEIYKQCGENRLERLHRIACADCQRGEDAYASAAAEYTRAAELAAVSEESDTRKRNECSQLYISAADAWLAINEKGKAGQCLINSACALLIGLESSEDAGTPVLLHMDKKALTAFEQAIEAHVPDPFNRFRTYRRTGTSAYASTDPHSQQSRLVAQENIVNSPYAHEAVSVALRKLLHFTEYASALYAAGAVSALLEREMATISLHRAYLTETVIQLAMKDVVAADKTFLENHLQRNSYLQSRECKLAEDLIRAVKSMDIDALDAAKVDNRAALANLDPTLRLLVMNLRVSALSKKKYDAIPKSLPPQPMTTEPIHHKHAPPHEHLQHQELSKQLQANYAEMDKIMEDMGFNDMEEDEEEDQQHEQDDDSDIDLR